ncbi:MAG: YkgJ family cysteine cluster protein [Sideroxydans sp.]|nr:YkgJ family cysteine cluster protein [Sideroxydans sp.]
MQTIKIHAAGNKCSSCKASSCCTYITQAIKKPRDQHDFQNLLWQVAHENVSVFKDDNGWFLLIDGRCEHLQPNGLCGIYATRPLACSDHSDDNCEFGKDMDDMFDLYFPDYDSLLQHCKKKFKHWGEEEQPAKKKKKKSKSK